MSQATLDGCTGVPVRSVGRLLLKGKNQPLDVATPDATLNTTQCAARTDYEAALRSLQAGPGHDADHARTQFESLAERHPQDPLVALHVQRLRAGAADDLVVMVDK